MGVVRGLGRGVGGLIVLAPILALPLAMVLDRGPRGNVRVSLFPAALTVLDPFLWECARNSLAVSALVTCGALVLGVRLARIVVRWRFRGRSALAALSFAPLAVPPLFGALGLRIAFGPSGPWRPYWEHFCALVRLDPRWYGWLAWVWVGLASGVPLVALATAHSLARVEPVWEDAARLAGADRRRVWRRIVWPLARPSAARAGSVVFLLTLFEPGAPLVLGLRRTLAFQAVEAALRADSASRAAVLALAASFIAVVGRFVLQWWGGGEASGLATVPVARPATASWLRTQWFRLVLGAGGGLACLPVLGVIGTALTPAPDDLTGGMRLTLAPALATLRAPMLVRVLTNSAVLGVVVVVLSLILKRLRVPLGGSGRFPPLAIGVGALALPLLFQMAADGLRGTPARVLQVVTDLLDPYRTRGVLLALAVTIVRAPLVIEPDWLRDRNRPERTNAALQLGAKRRQARRLAAGRGLGTPWSVLLLTFALAATNLSPALVLAPMFEGRTLAPTVLRMTDIPGDHLQRAAVLAMCGVVVNLFALALAARRLGARVAAGSGLNV